MMLQVCIYVSVSLCISLDSCDVWINEVFIYVYIRQIISCWYYSAFVVLFVAQLTISVYYIYHIIYHFLIPSVFICWSSYCTSLLWIEWERSSDYLKTIILKSLPEMTIHYNLVNKLWSQQTMSHTKITFKYILCVYYFY